MIIKGEEAKLAMLAITLKKARLEAETLECFCEGLLVCKKHKIVDDITEVSNKVKELLEEF